MDNGELEIAIMVAKHGSEVKAMLNADLIGMRDDNGDLIIAKIFEEFMSRYADFGEAVGIAVDSFRSKGAEYAGLLRFAKSMNSDAS